MDGWWFWWVARELRMEVPSSPAPRMRMFVGVIVSSSSSFSWVVVVLRALNRA